MQDTTPEAQAALLAYRRGLSEAERARQGFALCRFAREVRRRGIAERHPDYDDDQVRLALIRSELGDALYIAAYLGKPLLSP